MVARTCHTIQVLANKKPAAANQHTPYPTTKQCNTARLSPTTAQQHRRTAGRYAYNRRRA